LQLKGEKDVALKIYERGLRKVKIGKDDDRTVREANLLSPDMLTPDNKQTLQLQFNKLRQSLDPGKCLDPFTYLPIELAELVMQNLQVRDRVYV
jgi:F-box/TPR repeat protein Pof3